MAGLSNVIANTATQSTTMPAWYDTAQQNVVNQANAASTAAPAPQNTVAQNAVSALSGPTNAFTNAAGTLQGIASGAANPWITNPTTGAVTPDTSTAMGGLFAAQNQQLNQLAPNIMDPVTAAGTASGQFGSLRSSTAADKALADAQAQLFASQNQAALTNQATGVNAGIGAGNVAQQNIDNLLTTGQYQQAAPFTNASNYGKVLGGLAAPTTVTSQTQLSPLNQIMGLTTALGGQNSGGLLSSLFGAGSEAVGKPGDPGYKAATTPGILNQAYSGLSSLFNSNSTPTYTPPSGSTLNPDGTGNYTTPSGQIWNPTTGQIVDTSGSVSSGGANATTPTIDPTTGQVSTDPNQSGSIYDQNAYGAG